MKSLYGYKMQLKYYYNNIQRNFQTRRKIYVCFIKLAIGCGCYGNKVWYNPLKYSSVCARKKDKLDRSRRKNGGQ